MPSDFFFRLCAAEHRAATLRALPPEMRSELHDWSKQVAKDFRALRSEAAEIDSEAEQAVERARLSLFV